MSEVLKSSVSGLCRDATNIRPVADSECSTWKTLETDPFSPKKTVIWKDDAEVIVSVPLTVMWTDHADYC